MAENKCPHCGGQEFWANVDIPHDVLLDKDGMTKKDEGVNGKEPSRTYGPYCCINCGLEFAELPIDPKTMNKGCKKCGSKKFSCRFKYHGSAFCDEDGNWLEDINVDDAEFYGPYVCWGCGEIYDELPKGK